MMAVTLHKKLKSRRTAVVYPNIPSFIAAVPHCQDLPIPVLPSLPVVAETDALKKARMIHSILQDQAALHFPTQPELDTLVKDLSLAKEKIEILTSRLKR